MYPRAAPADVAAASAGAARAGRRDLGPGNVAGLPRPSGTGNSLDARVLQYSRSGAARGRVLSPWSERDGEGWCGTFAVRSCLSQASQQPLDVVGARTFEAALAVGRLAIGSIGRHDPNSPPAGFDQDAWRAAWTAWDGWAASRQLHSGWRAASRDEVAAAFDESAWRARIARGNLINLSIEAVALISDAVGQWLSVPTDQRPLVCQVDELYSPQVINLSLIHI